MFNFSEDLNRNEIGMTLYVDGDMILIKENIIFSNLGVNRHLYTVD